MTMTDEEWAAAKAEWTTPCKQAHGFVGVRRDFVTINATRGWELFLDSTTGLIFGYETVRPWDVPEVDLPDFCAAGCARLRDPNDWTD